MTCFFATDFCVGMSSLSSNDSMRAHVLMKDSTKGDRAVIRLMQRVDQGSCRALGPSSRFGRNLYGTQHRSHGIDNDSYTSTNQPHP